MVIFYDYRHYFYQRFLLSLSLLKANAEVVYTVQVCQSWPLLCGLLRFGSVERAGGEAVALRKMSKLFGQVKFHRTDRSSRDEAEGTPPQKFKFGRERSRTCHDKLSRHLIAFSN